MIMEFLLIFIVYYLPINFKIIIKQIINKIRFGHEFAEKDTHGLNSKRMAEVWMDDYKRLYYMHRSDLKVLLVTH